MSFNWMPLAFLGAAPILWGIGLRKLATLAGVVGLGLLWEAFKRH